MQPDDGDERDWTNVAKYFDMEDHGDNWRFWCKSCEQGYELPKSDRHPGNKIALFEHGWSHKPKKETSNA